MEGFSCCARCSFSPRLRISIWLYLFYGWYFIFTGCFLGLTASFPLWVLPLLLVAWNGIWLLTVSSLFAAAFTLPVPVPRAYRVPDDLHPLDYRRLAEYADNHPELRLQYAENVPDQVIYPRVCLPCGVFKPLRTHHCRTCGHCFPRMDHHCPVLGSCVHSHNHKFFILFLFWASSMCGVASLLMTPTIVQIFLELARDERHYLARTSFVQSLPTVMSIGGLTNAMACGVALLVFQVNLWLMLVRNCTTLEASGPEDYNLGSWSANIASIFGNDKRWWLLPVPSTPGAPFYYDFVQSEESEASEQDWTASEEFPNDFGEECVDA